MQTIGERIRDLRTNKDLSQAGMAEKMDISKSVISSYEAGYRKPSYGMLKRMADFFGCSTDYLMYGEALKDGSIPEKLFYLLVETGVVNERKVYTEKEWKDVEDLVRKAIKAAQIIREERSE